MNGIHDTRLRESFELQHDPALVEPIRFPWAETGFVLLAFLVVALIVLRLRRARPAIPSTVRPEPVEDTLAALELAWRSASPSNLAAPINDMAAIMRRYLSREAGCDCTTRTTAELSCQFTANGNAVESRAFRTLRICFFDPADQVRFAGLPATTTTVRGLYEAARDYVHPKPAKETESLPPLPPAGTRRKREGIDQLDLLPIPARPR